MQSSLVGGSSPAPLISPPASTMCPWLLFSAAARSFSLHPAPAQAHMEGERAHTKRKEKLLARKSVITELGLRDSTWQWFTRTAPPGASSPFHFIISKLGCQGQLLPSPPQKGTVASLICFESNSSAAPKKSVFTQESTNAMSGFVITAMPANAWSVPALARSGGAGPTFHMFPSSTHGF